MNNKSKLEQLYDRIRLGCFDNKISHFSAPVRHRAREGELRLAFRAALEEAHDELRGHPKAERLWTMAYERGHSSGWNEIALEYADLADLLKP